MSDKISDMEEKERTALDNQIRRAAAPLIDDEYTSRIHERPKLLEQYGLCATCIDIAFVATEFRIRLAACESHVSSVHGDFLLHSEDPITECTHYNERGRLSLRDMTSIATIIEINPKPAVGFKPKEKSTNRRKIK